MVTLGIGIVIGLLISFLILILEVILYNSKTKTISQLIKSKVEDKIPKEKGRIIDPSDDPNILIDKIVNDK